MSAIIAGKSCVGCEKPYSVSLGHPKWYDDVVKHRKPDNKDYLKFEEIRLSGMCIPCFVEDKLGFLLGIILAMAELEEGKE